MNNNQLVELYIKSLSPKEYQAYEIAKDHLKSLFDIENTNGFLHWKQKNEETLKLNQ